MADSITEVVLVGYEHQENLGLRSINAYLQSNNHGSKLIPFIPGDFYSVLTEVKRCKPRIIGFSLIFQFTVEEFGKLMRYLRENGVDIHFTAGGHFPSLRPEETLKLIPDLDSIVRFEGEQTLLELLENLEHPESWNKIPGLAFRTTKSSFTVTEIRPLIQNLDNLPLLTRDEPQQITNGIKMAALIASRGCLFNCSFCSIREFYGYSKGSLRRTRSPLAVVDEMLTLYINKNVRFFIFQDDDFASRTQSQQEWIKLFLRGLDNRRLTGKIAWKISCRVDDLNAELLEMMIDHGLVAVYLGVESGNEYGLKILNKNVSVEQNIIAVNLLKKYHLALAIGFMMFDPSSSIKSIKQNISFLREVGDDGYFPINFCKMLPYAGTPIEKLLRNQGRLKGTIIHPDYGFSDPILDWYEFLVQKVCSHRNFDPSGLVAVLQQVDFSLHLINHFDPDLVPDDIMESLKSIIRETNILVLDTLELLLDELLEYGIDYLINDQKRLIDLFEQEWRGEMKAEVTLMKLCSSVKILSEELIHL